MLSAATGLVILPSMDAEVRAESPAASSQESGEPRMLIERPATREAISTSKPARGLFPNLFGKKAEPSIQLPPREPGDTRSEVQRHLDALYGREGREAPTLDIGQPQGTQLSQPVVPQAASAQPGKASSASSEGSSPIRQVSSNPFKRFFQKITPFRRAKNPNDETPDHVEPLPANARREQLRLQQTPIAKPAAKSKPNLQPAPIPMSTEDVAARPALPALDLLVPPAPTPVELAEEAKPALEELKAPVADALKLEAAIVERTVESTDKLPEFLPAVELPQGEAPQLLVDELSDEPIGSKVSEAVEVATDDDLLGNPFPELSETEADGSSRPAEPAEVVKTEEAESSNPFSGLKLEAEAEAEEAASAVQQTAADSIPLPKLPDLPAPAELAAPDNAAPADKPVVNTSAPDGAHSDKLKKIAERSELTGLKGFCPVALRDLRELKDARPSFQAEFNGDYYNFSSAEALEKFKAEPQKYAPAAAGNDVVLSAGEGASQQGSLDRAVWYRNRLYLFSTKDSHEEFVASPSKFAVADE